MREIRSAKPLRLLQVGLGGWGRDWAWRIVPGVRSVRLVGCVDLSPESLELAKRELKLPAGRFFSSLERGLDSTDPDAVLVTTLLPGHLSVTRAALAAERGRTLMVSQNYRFFPAVRAVKRIIAEGKLGELGQIWIEFRRHSPVAQDGPRTHHAYDQPLLMDMSIHHFDLLRFLLGREANRVSCYTWNSKWTGFTGPPSASASIEFDGGVTASYRGSWINSGSITPWAGEWRMQFEHGELFWTSRGEDSTLDDTVVLQRGGRKAEVMALPRLRRIDRWGTLSEFADAVRQHRVPVSSGRENLGSLALMFAAVDSARKRKPVPVRVPLD